jgi:hypothetical protein
MVYSRKETLQESDRIREENKFKFQPTVSRGPKREEDTSVPQHDRLIEEGSKFMDTRKKRKEESLKQKIFQKIKTKSTDILEDKKKYILGNVFEVLDGDSDGFISKDNCDFDSLNKELKATFKPLIDDLRESNVRLNRDDFIDCSLQLYKKMTPTERSALIGAGRVSDRTPKAEEYSFTPKISKNSNKLARDVRPAAESVEHRLLSNGYYKEGRIKDTNMVQ